MAGKGKIMTAFIQVIVAGLLVGTVYGLFSSGLTVIFGVTRVVNFAHGDFVTLGMYAAVVLYSNYRLSPVIGIFPIVAGSFVLGYVLYRVIIQRTLKRGNVGGEEAQYGQLMLTLGLSTVIANALLLQFGPGPRSVQGVLGGVYNLDGVRVNESQLVAFGISAIAFAGLYLLVEKTYFGKAVRATVDDREMASMLGINIERVFAVAFGIGIALAGAAGAVLTTYFTVTPTVGEGFLVIAFVVVVMGGLGNIVGAMAAGLVAGVIQEVTATYVSLDLENAAIFAAFILVLAFRPNGLFGRQVVS